MTLFSKRQLISTKTKKYLVLVVLFSLIHNFIVFPVHAAMSDTADTYAQDVKTWSAMTVIKLPNSPVNQLEQLFSASDKPSTTEDFDFTLINTPLDQPQKQEQTTKSGPSRLVSLTAYTSESAQTDSDPCTTANGFNVCKHATEDTVAANFLPFGSKVKIPELYGDRVFIVRDRMARRFSNRVDVWMLKKSDALKFGVRHAHIEVLSD